MRAVSSGGSLATAIHRTGPFPVWDGPRAVTGASTPGHHNNGFLYGPAIFTLLTGVNWVLKGLSSSHPYLALVLISTAQSNTLGLEGKGLCASLRYHHCYIGPDRRTLGRAEAHKFMLSCIMAARTKRTGRGPTRMRAFSVP